MWKSFIYGVDWKHDGKMYYDEVAADSRDQAVDYFLYHKRDDVTLVRITLIGPNQGGVREPIGSPILPFAPLQARRDAATGDNAR